MKTEVPIIKNPRSINLHSKSIDSIDWFCMIETTVMKELTKYIKTTEYGLLTVAEEKFQKLPPDVFYEKDVLENFVNFIGPL